MNSASPTAVQARHVRAAFIGSFAAAICLIMAAFATAAFLLEASVRDRDLAERTAAVSGLFALKLDKESRLMRAVANTMMSNRALADAFRNGSREGIEQHSRAFFEALRSDQRITHLYFTDPQRINLYRLHNPAEYGDRIDRSTMLQAHSRAVPVHGLELGPLGTLTLRTVLPWIEDGRLLGYVEIGEEIQHLIDEVRDNLAVDVAVLIDKRYVAQDQWRRGQALMKRGGDWGRFSGHVVLAQTLGQSPGAFDESVLVRLLAGQGARIDSDGRSLRLAMVPLRDAAEHPIGGLVLMRDVTTLESTFARYMAGVVLLSLAVAGGTLGIFLAALRRVDKDYQRQRELEHQLIRLNTEHQRMLQLEKLSALGTMVGGIAHQLNNPLVGVVNLAQLAERDASISPSTRKVLAEIREAGHECRTFVRRMLEFSKASSFESRPTPIGPLIHDTVSLFRQAEARHLPVEVCIPDEPVTLDVDPLLLRHALFNLLQNAAQATPDHSPIEIRLARAPGPADRRPGWELAVTDHGHGIAPDLLDKIFVPFFTTRTDGTGLGLPVVQHVALLHNGHVIVASDVCKGARVSLWLPETPAEPS